MKEYQNLHADQAKKEMYVSRMGMNKPGRGKR
jgi:hypothetical protein